MIQIINGIVSQMTPEEEAEFLASLPVPPAAPPYRLYKSTLIRRLSDSEAPALKALLDAAPLKNQMIWAASDYLVSEDPLFTEMKGAIAQALGVERAGEILASE